MFCRPGWPQTQRSACLFLLVLGLKACFFVICLLFVFEPGSLYSPGWPGNYGLPASASFCLFLLLFQDWVSLCSFGYPETHSVEQASNSQRSSCLCLLSAGINVCTTTARLLSYKCFIYFTLIKHWAIEARAGVECLPSMREALLFGPQHCITQI